MSIFSVQHLGKNEFMLEEGSHIIITRFHGKQTVTGLEEAASAMKEKLAYLRRAKESALMMIDLSDIEKMDSETRKVVIRSMNSLDFDKLAIFGGPPLIGAIAKFLILLAGRSDKVHYLNNEKSAREWLEG